MLEMRPDCEACGADLPGDRPGAHICSFECTFCESCAGGDLDGLCPNCGGKLEPRPMRAATLHQKFPASTERRFEAGA